MGLSPRVGILKRQISPWQSLRNDKVHGSSNRSSSASSPSCSAKRRSVAALTSAMPASQALRSTTRRASWSISRSPRWPRSAARQPETPAPRTKPRWQETVPTKGSACRVSAGRRPSAWFVEQGPDRTAQGLGRPMQVAHQHCSPAGPTKLPSGVSFCGPCDRRRREASPSVPPPAKSRSID